MSLRSSSHPLPLSPLSASSLTSQHSVDRARRRGEKKDFYGFTSNTPEPSLASFRSECSGSEPGNVFRTRNSCRTPHLIHYKWPPSARILMKGQSLHFVCRRSRNLRFENLQGFGLSFLFASRNRKTNPIDLAILFGDKSEV